MVLEISMLMYLVLVE